MLSLGVDCRADAVEDLVHCSESVYRKIFALCGVVVCNNGSLCAIGLDAVAYNLFRGIIGATRLFATEQDAIDKFLFGDIHIYHHIDFQSEVCEDFVETLGLECCARKAVEDVAGTLSVFANVVGYDVDNHLVGSELASAYRCRYLLTEFCFVFDFVANNLACRDMVDSILLFKSCRLRTFAASRRAE